MRAPRGRQAGGAAARRARGVTLPHHDSAAGRRGRVLAPDLISGFGRSDKPTRPGDYTHLRHVSG